MKLKYISFPGIIILFGVLFSLYLQWYIAEGVFFSGDGGLKALLAQQFAAGYLRFDLIAPDISWIEHLWHQGLYPYEPPFVYNLTDKYFVTFPYTFPLVTAPFLAWFGERGMYIIPLVSTWIIWLNFYWVGRKIKLGSLSFTLGLFSLIFASYLTFYSAIYWEHTLAVALGFAGLSLYIIGNYPHKRTNTIAIFSGVLIGLSVWFRPEFLCLVGLLSGMMIFAAWNWFIKEIADKIFQIKEFKLLAAKKEIFIASMMITVAGFFLINQLIYGHFLGIHGIQAVEKIPFSDRVTGIGLNFIQMSTALSEYLPVIFFPVFCGLVITAIDFFQSKNKRHKIVAIGVFIFYSLLYTVFLNNDFYFGNLAIKLFALKWLPLIIIFYLLRDSKIKFNSGLLFVVSLASILFILGVAILVPVGTAGLIPGGKQWGVRFLLILVPIISFLIAIACNNLKTWRQYSLLIILIGLLAIGFHKNTIQALNTLENNLKNTLPAVEFIKQDNNKIIAVSQQFVAQALEPAVAQQKTFFKVEDKEQLIQLSHALVENNYSTFLYICYPHQVCQIPKIPPESLRFLVGDRYYQIDTVSLGKFGKYPMYQLSLKTE
jgi:hypothetical protein